MSENTLQRQLRLWFENMLQHLPEITQAQRERLRAESRRLIKRAEGRTIDKPGDLWGSCSMEFMAQMAIAGERAQAARAQATPPGPSKAEPPRPPRPGFDPRRN